MGQAEAIPGDAGWARRLAGLTGRIPRLPFPVVLLLLSLAIGVATGMDQSRFLAVFNRGFGQSLGYFAILLFSSFFLAASISRGEPINLGRLTVALSPFTGAGMVCPDTSYATLSPIAGRCRSSVAVGSYAGFKLLVPAGPLIIGVGLSADVSRPGFILMGAALTVPVMLAGLACLRFLPGMAEEDGRADGGLVSAGSASRLQTVRRLFPIGCLALLLIAGFSLHLEGWPLLQFLTSPMGALAATSILTYGLLRPEARLECLEAAMERTAPLLLVIASATALGVMLASVAPLGDLASAFAARHSRLSLVAILFGVTAIFKMVNGSSMATFAAVPPIVAPAVAASSLDATIAVYAICLGAFVAVLPNDSYFWLTQPPGGRRTDFSFTMVSVVQGLAGLTCLGAYLALGG
jgi:gluconate:H+ symporter, GntP family